MSGMPLISIGMRSRPIPGLSRYSRPTRRGEHVRISSPRSQTPPSDPRAARRPGGHARCTGGSSPAAGTAARDERGERHEIISSMSASDSFGGLAASYRERCPALLPAVAGSSAGAGQHRCRQAPAKAAAGCFGPGPPAGSRPDSTGPSAFDSPPSDRLSFPFARFDAGPIPRPCLREETRAV